MITYTVKIVISYNTASGMSCCNESPSIPEVLDTVGYNTASGMSCCNLDPKIECIKIEHLLQYRKRYELLQLYPISSSNFIYLLQYRKRYELLQRKTTRTCINGIFPSYNTASGMSCCNTETNLTLLKTGGVTIPQAV